MSWSIVLLSVAPWSLSRSTGTSRFPSTTRWPLTFGGPSPRGRLDPENASHRPRTWPAVLGVNTNTVLRALRLLRDEGLLEFRRGKGISVAGTPERSAVLATARARELVQFARGQGFRRDELIEMIEGIA